MNTQQWIVEIDGGKTRHWFLTEVCWGSQESAQKAANERSEIAPERVSVRQRKQGDLPHLTW